MYEAWPWPFKVAMLDFRGPGPANKFTHTCTNLPKSSYTMLPNIIPLRVFGPLQSSTVPPSTPWWYCSLRESHQTRSVLSQKNAMFCLQKSKVLFGRYFRKPLRFCFWSFSLVCVCEWFIIITMSINSLPCSLLDSLQLVWVDTCRSWGELVFFILRCKTILFFYLSFYSSSLTRWLVVFF